MLNAFMTQVWHTKMILKNFSVNAIIKGKKPTEIFRLCGFDTKVLGSKRIERAEARWKKLKE